MWRAAEHANFQRNKVKIGDYCYISSSIDRYPPLHGEELTKFKITTDIDKLDGISKSLWRIEYDSPVPEENDRIVFPRSEVHEYHEFTEEPVIQDYRVRVVAFTPYHLFTTKYTEKVTWWGDKVPTPSTDLSGEIPEVFEYLFPYGAAGKQEALLEYGSLYYCNYALAEFPESVIWQVPFDSRYLLDVKYPRVIKEIHDYHKLRNAATRPTHVAALLDQDIKEYRRLNIDRIEHYLSVRKYMLEDWFPKDEEAFKIAVITKLLSELSVGSVTHVLELVQNRRISLRTFHGLQQTLASAGKEEKPTKFSTVARAVKYKPTLFGTVPRKRTRLQLSLQSSDGSNKKSYCEYESSDGDDELLDNYKGGSKYEYEYNEDSVSEYECSEEDTDEEV
jgi:hypothetical protein